MTTLYSIVTNLYSGETEFAIAATDETATYVFPQGQEVPGLDDARIRRVYERAKNKPGDANGWLRLALYNTGHNELLPPVEVDGDMQMAIDKARAEVELDLAQQDAAPVNPNEPHEFVPLALGDEVCGYCEQDPDAEVHQNE